MFVSLVYLLFRRALAVAALRVRSREFKELEMVLGWEPEIELEEGLGRLLGLPERLTASAEPSTQGDGRDRPGAVYGGAPPAAPRTTS